MDGMGGLTYLASAHHANNHALVLVPFFGFMHSLRDICRIELNSKEQSGNQALLVAFCIVCSTRQSTARSNTPPSKRILRLGLVL